jgi:ABC-type multidrug transport system fused ATPase/permease subunit
MKLMLQALRRVREERRSVVLLALLAIVTAQVESAALVLVGLTIEGFASGGDQIEAAIGPVSTELDVTRAIGMAFGLLVIGAALSVLFTFEQTRTSARLERRYRDRLTAAFAAADWEYQSTQRSGKLNGLLRWTASAPILFMGLTSALRAFTMVIVFLVVAFTVNWQAALVTSALGALFAAFLLPLRRRVRSASLRHTRLEMTYSQDLSEAVDVAPDLRVFGGWPAIVSRLDGQSAGIESLRRYVDRVTTAVPLTFQYGGPIMVVSLILFLPKAASGISLGSMAAVGFLLLRVIQFGQALQGSQQQILRTAVVVDQLVDALDDMERRQTPRGDLPLPAVTDLELSDVHYTYPATPREALAGLSVTLRAGEVVGVVGPSGGGKSTLGQILLGLRYPSSGQLLVNGVPSPHYSAEAWYRRVVHVPQQPHLLHGTVAENVALFDPAVSEPAIWTALHQVGLEEFVRGLPDGLETPIGPATRALSGGQLQRLAIARALARRPDVIVLDEPTSALDVDSENVVQEALAGLRDHADLLIVVIAHRVSTLAMCDRILVLDQGRLVANGSPQVVADGNEFFGRALQAQALV